MRALKDSQSTIDTERPVVDKDPATGKDFQADKATSSFYQLLRHEVSTGNPNLSERQQRMLQSHYPVMMAPERFPEDLVTAIYTSRRSPIVDAIRRDREAVVFDAGCGYGSESFLFAASGARVLAVDRSADQIVIAKKRQRFFEEALGQTFDIEFRPADLNVYSPESNNLSLTWLASVLAVVPDQEGLLRRVHRATRTDGEIMITDMNLLNPLFLFREWRRRRWFIEQSPEFRRHANFFEMVRRHERRGARYFKTTDGDDVDDVQFFRPGTLAELLRTTGFSPAPASYSGFIPPIPVGRHEPLERLFARIPLIRKFGYFYFMRAQKTRPVTEFFV